MCDKTCDYCGIEDTKLITQFETWELLQCNQCGLRWGMHRPDIGSLAQLYDQNYFSSDQAKTLGYTNYEDERPLRLRTFDSRFDAIERYKSSGTCIDVGCAFGFSLSVAKRRGWEACGLDISEHAYTVLRAAGFDGLCGDFLTLEPCRRFDLVTAWDVIEHCASPAAFMRQANAYLKDRGVLALTTPDGGSLLARLSSRRWFEYKWPEHLFYLSRKLLELYCKKFGFQVLTTRSAMKYKYIGDAIARWIGLYEANFFLNRIFGKRPIAYSSFSEIFLIARKIATI